MINFTVGPVQSSNAVHEIGAEDVPYFRTAEFSKVMLENERLMLKLVGAPKGSRAVFITGSGTASMEAVVMNLLTQQNLDNACAMVWLVRISANIWQRFKESRLHKRIHHFWRSMKSDS